MASSTESATKSENPGFGCQGFHRVFCLLSSGRADSTTAITEGACSCVSDTKTGVFGSASPTEGDARQPEITPRWVTGGKRVRTLLCLPGEPTTTPPRGDPGPQARPDAPSARQGRRGAHGRGACGRRGDPKQDDRGPSSRNWTLGGRDRRGPRRALHA